ncbi:MAG: helix-hairpin-helix domain-containing protein [Candidatus Omnitrophota bacterium]
MFSLSPPERKALIIIAVVIFLGTLIRYFNLEVDSTTASYQPAEKPLELIDINQASISDLERISGLGPVLSQRIVEYRKNNSPFKTIDDLKKVKGIGEKKAEIITEYIKF